MDFEIVGAIKIKDGLFLGDEFAAQVKPRLRPSRPGAFPSVTPPQAKTTHFVPPGCSTERMPHFNHCISPYLPTGSRRTTTAPSRRRPETSVRRARCA